jgi:phosphatidylglycerol---prolipoprotein diacylglyceryl transferase
MIPAFVTTWQNLPYQINPVAFSIGSLTLLWYSIMYISGLLVAFLAFIFLTKKEGENQLESEASNFFNIIVLGIIIGSRLGYVIFYQPAYYFSHPLEIFLPFQNGQFSGISGLSYHGGLIGYILSVVLIGKIYTIKLTKLLNMLAIPAALGYTLGRIGNFLNLELYGRPTTAWIGMYFPTDPIHVLRFPSQLFEAFGEGILIVFILLALKKNPKTKHFLAPAYLILYGIIRFIIEFYREPDSFQNLLFGLFSYGQVLCGAMILSGIGFIFIFKKSLIDES